MEEALGSNGDQVILSHNPRLPDVRTPAADELRLLAYDGDAWLASAASLLAQEIPGNTPHKVNLPLLLSFLIMRQSVKPFIFPL